MIIKLGVLAALFGLTPAASATDPADKPAFYLALSAMDKEGAELLMVLDKDLEERCGRSQSVEYMRSVAVHPQIASALAMRNLATARVALINISCEPASSIRANPSDSTQPGA